MGYSDPEKQREYQRGWIAERRARYMQGQSCFMCGSTENIELDHRDPSQKVSHRIWNWSIPRIEEEIAKCDWLCRGCHVLKTLLLDVNVAGHGTLSGYRNGCRCRPCIDAKMVFRNKENAISRAKKDSTATKAA